MTLRDRFKKLICKNFTINQLEQVADEFAIGFTEWISDNTLRVELDGYKTFGDDEETKPHTIKELLEIYKTKEEL
jgi:hypothetical protein